MVNFFDNRDKLIQLLIKQRCGYASKTDSKNNESKYLKLNDEVQNVTETQLEKQAEEEFIRTLFPPRSRWVHLGRKNHRNNLDAEKRNRVRLWLTYLKYRQKKSEPWISKLNRFVDELQQCLCNPPKDKMNIDVCPQYKSYIASNATTNIPVIECRPLCSFRLRDRILLSYLNYYLTLLFDEDFLDCSYAFRAPRKNDNRFPHIRAIQDLQLYRKTHPNVILYVAECDMKKFFDTISHSVIRNRFTKLLNKHNEIYNCEKNIIIKWLDRYLDSYNFYDNVYVLNTKHPQKDRLWRCATIEAKKTSNLASVK